MKPWTFFFRDLPIRYKLLGAYSSIFIITLMLGGLVLYSLVRHTIEGNIESELKNTTTTIESMVRTAANTSIKNHLRAAAVQNREIIAHIYSQQQQGLLSATQARTRARDILLSQTIGKTGYIYCVDSLGVALVHPNPGVQGGNFLQQSFVRQQIQRKEGYLEYEWQNPGEKIPRAKSLYMTYFEPWDWIISVSSYREEFSELINVSDFRDSILALQFGQTGYSYVLDSKGNLVIHPILEGNAYDFSDAQGDYFVRRICELKNGKLIYSWKNPEESTFRDKLVIFNHIPEYDWIVASSCYLEESYAPLNKVRNVILATLIATLLLALIITWLMSMSIVKPLKRLMVHFRTGSSGNLQVRMDDTPKDEIGQLAGYFNAFMDELERSNHKLLAEVRERKQAEEKYRTILERMEEGYYEVDQKGQFAFFNDALLTILGYSQEQLLKLNIRDIAETETYDQITRTLRQIRQSGNPVKTADCELIRGDGTKCFIETSISIIENREGEAIGYRGVMKDVTAKRKADQALRLLEREILDISEREHQKIGRDLHDDLCPHLLGIEVLSEVLRQRLEEQSLQESTSAQKIQTLIQDSITKLKRLSKGLYPVDLMEQGFDSALADLAFLTQDIFGVACHFQCESPVSFNNATVAMNAYYIAHEAVHNAIKHAEAQNVFIYLSWSNQKIKLEVKDDGSGISGRDTGCGMGLRIMDYRARRIGAELEVLPNGAAGTQITLLVDPQTNQDRGRI